MRLARVAALGMAVVVLAGGPAGGESPTAQLRSRIDQVLRTLEDPELRQETRGAERRATIRAIAHELFDFHETAQRSLARHGQARTPAEREEFTALFADLIERSYIGRIETYTGGERIVFAGDVVQGDRATVRTRILTRQGAEIPVDYRMHRKGDRWLAYDVAIEGVSMVASYRAQFNKIIQTSSYRDLVDKLRTKQAEAAEAEPPGPRASRR